MPTSYDAFISYSHKADGKLAPALESALEGFAKPWYRRRALSLFRDQTSLSASPGLWPSIEQALSSSRYFLLLASPRAAASRWVQQEVAWWLEHKSPQTLLIGLTDGRIKRPEGAKDFDWEQTDALPPNLKGVFTENPLWVDFRWAQDQEHLSTKNPEFQSALAALAAPLRNIPKEDLIGEDVRQHRRALLLARGAALILIGLLLFAGWQWWQAVEQRERAEEQARLARSRQLAAQAVGLTDRQTDLALLLSVEANRVADTAEARGSALNGLLASPHLLTFLQGHWGDENNGVESLAFSPDGQLLASGGCGALGDNDLCDRGEIWLWDATTGSPRGRALAGHGDEVRALAFTSVGKTLVSWGTDGTLASWDPESGRQVRDHGANPAVYAGFGAAFSPDGKLVAANTIVDDIIVVWDVATGEPVAPPLAGHTETISSLAFSPDGRTLASGSWDGTTILWDIGTGEKRHPPLRRPADRVTSVAFSADGTMLAAAGFDGSITLWDVASGQPRERPLAGHTERVESLAFSPDGKMLASGSSDGTIILWDYAAGRPYEEQLTGNASLVDSLVFSSDSTMLASGHRNGAVILWSVSGTTLGTTLMSRYYEERLSGGREHTPLVFSRDGKTLAWTERGEDRRGTVVLWDVAAGQPQAPPLLADDEFVTDIAFNPDGQALAWGTSGGVITLWDLTSGAARAAPLDGHNGRWVDTVAFSPDGNTLASSAGGILPGELGSVVLWDVAPGQPVRPRLTLRSDEDPTSLAFVGDGKTLASGHRDGTIVLWDTSTGEPRGEPLKCRGDWIYSLTVSPDGKILAASCAQATITLWDLPSRQPLVDLATGDQSNVNVLDFSPDGRTLASGSASVILWDIATGQQLGPPFDPRGVFGVSGVAFSPDGKSLASGYDVGEEAGVTLWDVYDESWNTRACRVAGRNLSGDEWRRYFPEELYRETCPGLASGESAASPAPAATALSTIVPAATPAILPAATQALAEAAEAALAGDADRAVAAYQEAFQLAIKSDDAQLNNAVCWSGSLDGYAELVMQACERGVALAPARDRGQVRDSRGLARALTGNFSGAADDFEAFVEWSMLNGQYRLLGEKREDWIVELEANRSPFDEAMLTDLRDE